MDVDVKAHANASAKGIAVSGNYSECAATVDTAGKLRIDAAAEQLFACGLDMRFFSEEADGKSSGNVVIDGSEVSITVGSDADATGIFLSSFADASAPANSSLSVVNGAKLGVHAQSPVNEDGNGTEKSKAYGIRVSGLKSEKAPVRITDSSVSAEAVSDLAEVPPATSYGFYFENTDAAVSNSVLNIKACHTDRSIYGNAFGAYMVASTLSLTDETEAVFLASSNGANYAPDGYKRITENNAPAGVYNQGGTFNVDDSRLHLIARSTNKTASFQYANGYTGCAINKSDSFFSEANFTGSSQIFAEVSSGKKDRNNSLHSLYTFCPEADYYTSSKNAINMDFDPDGWFKTPDDLTLSCSMKLNYGNLYLSGNTVIGDGSRSTSSSYVSISNEYLQNYDGEHTAYYPICIGIYGSEVSEVTFRGLSTLTTGLKPADFDNLDVRADGAKILFPESVWEHSDGEVWTACTKGESGEMNEAFSFGTAYRAAFFIEPGYNGQAFSDDLTVSGIPSGCSFEVLSVAEYTGDPARVTAADLKQRVVLITFPEVKNPVKEIWFYDKNHEGHANINSTNRYLVNGTASESGVLGQDGCTAYFDPTAGILYLDGYGRNATGAYRYGIQVGETVKYDYGHLEICVAGDSTVDGGILRYNDACDVEITSQNNSTLLIKSSGSSPAIQAKLGSVTIRGNVNVVTETRGSLNLPVYGINCSGGKVRVIENASLNLRATRASGSSSTYGVETGSLTIDTTGKVFIRAGSGMNSGNAVYSTSVPDIKHAEVFLLQYTGGSGSPVSSGSVTLGKNMTSYNYPGGDAAATAIYGFNEGEDAVFVYMPTTFDPSDTECQGGWIELAPRAEDSANGIVDAVLLNGAWFAPGSEVKIRFNDACIDDTMLFNGWWFEDDDTAEALDLVFTNGKSAADEVTTFLVPVGHAQVNCGVDTPYILRLNVNRHGNNPNTDSTGIFYDGNPVTIGTGSDTDLWCSYIGDGVLADPVWYVKTSGGNYETIPQAPEEPGNYKVILTASAGTKAAAQQCECAFEIEKFTVTSQSIRINLSPSRWVYDGTEVDGADFVASVYADLDRDGIFETEMVKGTDYTVSVPNSLKYQYAGNYTGIKGISVVCLNSAHYRSRVYQNYTVAAADQILTIDDGAPKTVIRGDMTDIQQQALAAGGWLTAGTNGAAVDATPAGRLVWELNGEYDGISMTEDGKITIDNGVEDTTVSVEIYALAADMNSDGINEYNESEHYFVSLAITAGSEMTVSRDASAGTVTLKPRGIPGTYCVAIAEFDASGRFTGFHNGVLPVVNTGTAMDSELTFDAPAGSKVIIFDATSMLPILEAQ